MRVCTSTASSRRCPTGSHLGARRRRRRTPPRRRRPSVLTIGCCWRRRISPNSPSSRWRMRSTVNSRPMFSCIYCRLPDSLCARPSLLASLRVAVPRRSASIVVRARHVRLGRRPTGAPGTRASGVDRVAVRGGELCEFCEPLFDELYYRRTTRNCTTCSRRRMTTTTTTAQTRST